MGARTCLFQDEVQVFPLERIQAGNPRAARCRLHRCCWHRKPLKRCCGWALICPGVRPSPSTCSRLDHGGVRRRLVQPAAAGRCPGHVCSLLIFAPAAINSGQAWLEPLVGALLGFLW